MQNYIELPCGCCVTLARHVMTCQKHSLELRDLGERNEKELDRYRDALNRLGTSQGKESAP